MTEIVVLPHHEICPEGAVIEAEQGESVLATTLGVAAYRNQRIPVKESFKNVWVEKKEDRHLSLTDRIYKQHAQESGGA